MGVGASSVYNQCRRIILRFNIENRTHRFLEKGQLTSAPRHPIRSQEDVPLSEEQLKELHGKNEQLNEYLKKVYLTSTSKVIGTPSKRPKPKKENEHLKVTMFYEPEKVTPGYCTLTNIVEILSKFQEDSDVWNVNGIASKYNLNKKEVAQLVMYYSLFTKEDLKFMHDVPKTEEEKEKIEFEVFNQLEKRPYKQIEGK